MKIENTMNNNIPVGYDNDGEFIGFNDEIATLEIELKDAQSALNADWEALFNSVKWIKQSKENLDKAEKDLLNYKKSHENNKY